MVRRGGSAWRKTVLREIRQTFGRFLAIFAITALGVGFFAGLKITRSAMISMGDQFMRQHQLFDYRLISTLGFTPEDVDAFNRLSGVRAAEGFYTTDFLTTVDQREAAFHAISMPQQVNQLDLTAGRLPQSPNECVADDVYFTETDLGRTLTVREDGDALAQRELTIVGLCNAVIYLYPDRGTTRLGSGALAGFVYVPQEAFDLEAFTELDITLQADEKCFSEAQQAALDGMKEPIQNLLDERVQLRFDGLMADAKKELDESQAAYDAAYGDYLSQRQQAELVLPAQQVEETFREAKAQLDDTAAQIAQGRQELADTPQPSSFCLNCSTNTGYASFENDSNIVEGIAKVFPLFFFLVAALVCSTTMSRMVEEQRTQIGTLKALGYSNGKIIGKYAFYAGSASVFGCIFGYFAGTWLFPKAIWHAYKMLYHFAEISYVFDGTLAAISLAVSLICSVGVTFASCRTELRQMPAQLMRPKAPKAGKRVLLERIGPVWNRLGFLRKVSIRNIFRYKKRLFMMLLGIGGCTALLLTGFGISDSIANIANDQFDTITKYDLVVSFPEGQSSRQQADFLQDTRNLLTNCVFVSTETYEVKAGGTHKLNVIATDDANLEALLGLQQDGEAIPYPTGTSAVVTDGLARLAGISVGDTLQVAVSDTKTVPVTISAITDNYIYHYLFLSGSGFQQLFGEGCHYDTAYATCSGDPYQTAASLQNDHGAGSVSVIQDLRNQVDKMMRSLNGVIYLVIGSACALAFVVMYNLSNINITERLREIATIKVLGFYPRETHQYVFRENLLLSLGGMAVGLPGGVLLHRFVMSQIKVSMVSFPVRILPLSYAFSAAVVLGVTLLVNLLLSRKIDRIHMAESLKSVE